MKILLLDIETSPNTAHVWGLWQQNVGLSQLLESSYTLCWSAKWLGEKGTIFSSLEREDGISMMEKLWELLNEADAVVHYNGSKFDIPTINKEFLQLGLSPPSPYKQIDLLRVCKKQFKFPSNKLEYVAQKLGLGGKVRHKGHELWIKCMNNDLVAWRKMERYNKQDVRLLEKLYKRLLPWIDSHPNHALYTDLTNPVCPNCGSHRLQKRGIAYTRVGQYQRFYCLSCGRWPRGRYGLLTKEERENVLT